MDRLTFDGNFCDIAMCREQKCPYDGSCSQREVWERLKAYEDTGLEPEEIEKAMEDCADTVAKNQFAISDINEMCGVDHLRELIQAEKDWRLVVLPFPVHSVLVNMADLEVPELLKDFRISATYTHCGIVFHMPWGIFSELVKAWSIDLVSQDTEAALKGG